jgi:hypothetical protein
VPRVRRMPFDQSHCEPRVSTSGGVSNIICYCDACDEKIELGLPSRLSKLCNCNQYKRWICHSCSNKESSSWEMYAKQGGVREIEDHEEPSPPSNLEEGLCIYLGSVAITVCIVLQI